MGGSGAGEAAGDEVELSSLGVVGADIFVDGDFWEGVRVDGDRLFVDVAVGTGLDCFGIVPGDRVGEAADATEEFAVSEH
nr:hypothetical protein [Picosynechococcus sp. NKBG15041c]